MEKKILTKNQKMKIQKHRQEIQDILSGKDNRKLVITGPCSIHDIGQAMEIAHNLKQQQELHKDTLKIIMRTYYDKPRTVTGWEGFAYDPDLNGTYNKNKGIKLMQKLMSQITDLDLALGFEVENPIMAENFLPYASWVALGARSSEDQTTRKNFSNYQIPIGAKHRRGDGCLVSGAQTVHSINNPHKLKTKQTLLKLPFGFEIAKDKLIQTPGNKYTSLILRGHDNGTNLTEDDMLNGINQMQKLGVPNTSLICDLSHDNCLTNNGKDWSLQPNNLEQVLQIASQNELINKHLKGIMIESNINPGNQKIGNGTNLKYGVSITDGCVNLKTNSKIIQTLSNYQKNPNKYQQQNQKVA